MNALSATFRRLSCRLRRLSTAARVTCCLVAGLVIVLFGVWISYAWNPQYVPWATYMSWSRGGMLAALIVGLAVVTYSTIRTWLAEDRADRSVFSAWNKGLRELRYHGLPTDALPIHLILGAGVGNDEEQLIRASGEYRFVQPTGSGGLTFFANSSRVCVSAGGIGVTALARTALADKVRNWSPDAVAFRPERFGLGSESVAEANSDSLSQTLEAVGWEDRPENDDHEFADNGWDESGAGVGVMAPVATQTIPKPLALIRNPLETVKIPLWSLPEVAVAEQKLQQLANLIRSTRRPLCPINRTIIVIPVAALLGNPERLPELQQAIRRDLEILQQELQINAPVTVLISGLENHPGFVEFMRRVGPQTLQQQTLGQAVEVGSPATRSQMEALAINACGEVEDCLYALLQKETSLSSAGNTMLYRLLCDLRTGIRQSLSELLTGALATEDTGQYIAGCYFCASGSQPQQRGFVEAVWQLQDHGQEELDWFPQALHREALHRALCRAGWLATAALTLTWIGLLRTWWVQ